jgi:hypothetical protein
LVTCQREISKTGPVSGPREAGDPFGDRDDLRLAGEHLLHQDSVDFVIGVCARVGEDDEAVVRIRGMSKLRSTDLTLMRPV